MMPRLLAGVILVYQTLNVYGIFTYIYLHEWLIFYGKCRYWYTVHWVFFGYPQVVFLPLGSSTSEALNASMPLLPSSETPTRAEGEGDCTRDTRIAQRPERRHKTTKKLGSTISTLLHDRIKPKDCQVLWDPWWFRVSPNFFGLFQVIMAKP